MCLPDWSFRIHDPRRQCRRPVDWTSTRIREEVLIIFPILMVQGRVQKTQWGLECLVGHVLVSESPGSEIRAEATPQ